MKQELSKIQTGCEKFLNSCRSVILSTLDNDGLPHASYAPFIRDHKGRFHVYVSSLAKHATTLANGQAGVMLIADESDTKQIFARNRLTFECTLEVLERDSATSSKTLTEFRQTYGPVIDMLTSLPDFILFRLTPSQGVYVTGFGQAYRVNACLDSLVPITSDSIDSG